MFFLDVCSSLGYGMECIKLLSSQVREGFPICSAFLPYLQTHHPPGMTWDLLGVFERSGQEEQGELSWLLRGASSLLFSSPGKPDQEANLAEKY